MSQHDKFHPIKISRQEKNYYVCIEINSVYLLMPLLSCAYLPLKVNSHEYATSSFFSQLPPYCFFYLLLLQHFSV